VKRQKKDVLWGYGFLFRSEFFFRTTQELEYLFCLSRKARIFLTEFNIRLYGKNSGSWSIVSRRSAGEGYCSLHG
jgi:hypothetical protein